MSDLLDSDGPDYDPEAYAEMIDNARKSARENGEPGFKTSAEYDAWKQAKKASMKGGHVWFIRHFGLWTWVQYERARRRSERAFMRPFDPKRDGAKMLRRAGFSEAEIEHFREHGLA